MDNTSDAEMAVLTGAAHNAYARMKPEREHYLIRARDASELTIPTLFRAEDSKGSDAVIVPWNSIGAYLVNNLASKIIFALFPAGRPNFKAEQDKRTQQDLLSLDPNEQARIKQVIDLGLSKLETEVASAIEEDGDRARMFVAALRMIIGGNHALQFYPDGTIRGIPLERYTVRRDPQGNLVEWCICDGMDWDLLDEDLQQAIREYNPGAISQYTGNMPKPVEVYTYGKRKGGLWKVHQEVCAVIVPDSEREYQLDYLPYLFLPWLLLDGEHYGRSYCEFYMGDLQSAEGFTKTIGEGAAALARFLILVNPVGMTNKKQLAEAENGEVIAGREADVHVVTSQKSADFSIAQSTLNDALNRLGRAFLLNSSAQRQGERVTAEEIRAMIQELEDALGGVYSQQQITWQGPYVKQKLQALQKSKRVTPLPKNTVKITVTAGLAALGRNAELASLRSLVSIIVETFGAEKALELIKGDGFISRACAALGVDPQGLIYTPEELAEKQQQAQQASLIQQLGPEALRQFGSNVTGRQVADINAQSKVEAASAKGASAPAAEASPTAAQ